MALSEKKLEFLYEEDDAFLFLDVLQLEIISIPKSITGKSNLYLKEGIQVRATVDEDGSVLSIQLPQFLELMVAKVDKPTKSRASQDTKLACLETGAQVNVPLFIEVGDIIKVDPQNNEYIQRV